MFHTYSAGSLDFHDRHKDIKGWFASNYKVGVIAFIWVKHVKVMISGLLRAVLFPDTTYPRLPLVTRSAITIETS